MIKVLGSQFKVTVVLVSRAIKELYIFFTFGNSAKNIILGCRLITKT
ncbi:MAG: hypothetical protein ABFR75_13175 [Acidobacteriota bacterium]